ncbi:MAG: signal peptidase II, partial [Anaerolineae bacterium]
MQPNVSSPPTHTLRSRLFSLAILLLIGAVIFTLDRITKMLVVQNLEQYASWAPVPALERLVKITHITNSGAAFGLFDRSGNLFMVVAILVALAIIYYVSTYPSLPGLVQFSLGLQLGGALGNMWDRVQQGSVVDFVDIGFWPIFN